MDCSTTIRTDGSIGTAKRVLSLRGVADSALMPECRFPTLTEQIKHSVQSNARNPLSDEQARILKSISGHYHRPRWALMTNAVERENAVCGIDSLPLLLRVHIHADRR